MWVWAILFQCLDFEWLNLLAVALKKMYNIFARNPSMEHMCFFSIASTDFRGSHVVRAPSSWLNTHNFIICMFLCFNLRPNFVALSNDTAKTFLLSHTNLITKCCSDATSQAQTLPTVGLCLFDIYVWGCLHWWLRCKERGLQLESCYPCATALDAQGSSLR